MAESNLNNTNDMNGMFYGQEFLQEASTSANGIANVDYASTSTIQNSDAELASTSASTTANAMDDQRKIFVGGLTWGTSETELRDYFGQFGEIANINLKINPVTGQSRCFAFVTFATTRAQDVVNACPLHYIDGKNVDVKPAIPRGSIVANGRGGTTGIRGGRGGLSFDRGGMRGGRGVYYGRGFTAPTYGQGAYPPFDGNFGSGFNAPY